MRVFEVADNSIRSVMNQLLKGGAFDGFLVRGAEISVFTKVEISGILNKSFYPEEERDNLCRNYIYWKEIKPYALSLIKGDRAPAAFKVVFSLTDREVKTLHDNASAMFLNLLYEENKLRFTTAISQRNFSLDKSVDAVWDAYIQKYLNAYGWSVSTLD